MISLVLVVALKNTIRILNTIYMVSLIGISPVICLQCE